MENRSLSLRNITKTYPGVVALNDFSLDFFAGETHAIVGENGAGKSTMIKIVSGAIKPDSGTISVFDKIFDHMNPAMSRQMGIEVIYQEFNLVETLSAAENIYLGTREGAFVDYTKMNKAAADLFRKFEVDIDPQTLVRDLSPAQQQIVEIVKAISKNARVLIMDEPTAPLTMKEVELLFKIIEKIKNNGVTILYVSHRLDEIFEIADRVTVLRDGCFIKTMDISDTDKSKLIQQMVGRELVETYPQRNVELGDIALEARNISGNGCSDISFTVRHGEILGFAGLVGAGRTELMRALIRADGMDGGAILINGRPVHIKQPRDAVREGIGLIPEDRKNQGCFLSMDIEWNASIMNIKRLRKRFLLDKRLIENNARDYIKKLNIKVPSLETKVANLSGGNQQKVALAKTLAADCKILIFDEPTRGIDVGAKQEIYALMRQLSDEGHAIIMISSEMGELLGMSDRIIVMRSGRSVKELGKDEFSQVRVLEYASGIVQ